MATLLMIILVLPLSVLTQDDPCTNYRMLYDDGGRSTKCSLYYSKSHDRFIDEGWRRVQLESTGEDLTMPIQCVPHGYCGSHSNVWLNGTHPTVEDGIVDRVGCVSMFSSCCKVEYPIQIKNCTEYMVYNLKRTFGSDERYCFGDSSHCYPSSRPTNITSSTVSVAVTTTINHGNRSTSVVRSPTTGSTIYHGNRSTSVVRSPTTKSTINHGNRATSVMTSTTSTKVQNKTADAPLLAPGSRIDGHHDADDVILTLAVCLSLSYWVYYSL